MKGFERSRQGLAGPYSQRIDSLFAEWDRDSSPGAVLGVVSQGELIHQRGYGVAVIEHDVPFTADTVLRLGSTSKHLCATCILVLESRGQLQLADDIRRFVPEMPEYDTPITLRHLLTMTSGLWDGLNMLLFCGLDTSAALTREQLLSLYVAQDQLMYQPGDDCTYSNTNYSLLSLVVERVSGMSLAEFMRQEIFAPLEMTNSRLTPFMGQPVRNKAEGYIPSTRDTYEKGFMRVELDGNGGVDSSLADMLKWLANYREDQLFGFGFRSRLEAPSYLNDGRMLDYRLGVHVADYRGMKVVRHAGGMPGYLCDFVFCPEADFGLVLLANVLAPEILELPDRIADIVLEEVFTLPRETTFVTLDSAGFAAYLGVYADEASGQLVELMAQDGKLVCYFLGELNPLHEAGGWLKSRKNELAIRPADVSTGPAAGLVLQLGCRKAVTLAPVDHPRNGKEGPGIDPQEFTGTYFNESLREVHVIRCESGGLEVGIRGRVRSLPWSKLTAVSGDLFVAMIDSEPSCTNVTLKFLRNPAGEVEGFSYSINRCSRVVFHRQKALWGQR